MEFQAARPSADRRELPLPLGCGSLHDPLRSPVVDPRRLGGSVDRCAVTAYSQHRHHRLDGLRGHTRCNQLRRKVCIDLLRLGLAESCTAVPGRVVPMQRSVAARLAPSALVDWSVRTV